MGSSPTESTNSDPYASAGDNAAQLGPRGHAITHAYGYAHCTTCANENVYISTSRKRCECCKCVRWATYGN
jgi:hypothetical protein